MEVALYHKFINGYEAEVAIYDAEKPKRQNWNTNEEAQRNKYFTNRMLEVNARYKERLKIKDSVFYESLEKRNYNDKEVNERWRYLLWDYLAYIGWYKNAIKDYANNGDHSLTDAINKTKSWSTGESSEALSIKNLTISLLEDARHNVNRKLEELDKLACVKTDYLYNTEIHKINDDAFAIHEKAVKMQHNNINLINAAIINTTTEGKQKAGQQTQSYSTTASSSTHQPFVYVSNGILNFNKHNTSSNTIYKWAGAMAFCSCRKKVYSEDDNACYRRHNFLDVIHPGTVTDQLSRAVYYTATSIRRDVLNSESCLVTGTTSVTTVQQAQNLDANGETILRGWSAARRAKYDACRASVISKHGRAYGSDINDCVNNWR